MKECPVCFTNNDDSAQRCSACNFDFVNGNAESTIANMRQDNIKKSARSSVSDHPVKWSARKADFVFQTPDIVEGYYFWARVVAWLIAIGKLSAGFVALSHGEGKVALALILKSALGLVIALAALRIIYELIILFFEQLRVIKQIRDMIKDSQKS